MQLQASEEALADARIALAREREYAEIMNQDDDHAAAQAAEMKHQVSFCRPRTCEGRVLC